jgi:hypothetical protein
MVSQWWKLQPIITPILCVYCKFMTGGQSYFGRTQYFRRSAENEEANLLKETA